MSATVGAALRAARERRQLTLAQVSEVTRVRSHYLQALENDDISAMPSAAQARGFLRIYAEFLGLEVENLIPAAGTTSVELPAPGGPADDEPESVPPAAGPLVALGDRIASWLAARFTSEAPKAPEEPELAAGRPSQGSDSEEHSPSKKKRN